MAKVKRGRYRGLNPRDVQAAQAAGKVRYGPQQSALAGLVSQALSTKKEDITAAKSGAQSAIVHARRARKPISAIYSEATGAADSAASDVATAFGNLGAAADPFRAATAREQGAAKTRLTTAKAGALTDLSQRQTEARVGRQLAVNEARSKFNADMSKLGEQLRALGDQQGAFEAETIANRMEARAGRRSQENIAKLYSGGKGGKGGGGGGGSGDGGGATNIQLKDLRDQIAKARSLATQLKTGNYQKRVPGKEGKTRPGDPLDRAQAHDKLISKLGIDDSAARIALDVVYDNQLSGRNVRMLRNLGFPPVRLELGQYLPGNVAARRQRTRRKGVSQQQDYYEGG